MSSQYQKQRKNELLSMTKQQLIDIILKQENNSNNKRSFSLTNDSSNNKLNHENELKEPPTKKQKTSSTYSNNNHNHKNKKKKRTFDMNKYYQRHVAFKFAYLGTKYDGFMRQENSKNTIEEYLFAAFIKTCLITDINNCNYSRCGRTDKGVSSLGNVISLTVRSKLKYGKGIIPKNKQNENENENKMDIENNDKNELDYIDMLNNVLPTDIRILSWAPVNINFNSRFHCKSRCYKYLFYKNGMDINAMKQAAKLLIGTNDYRNFCKMDVVNVNNFVREIIDVSIEPMDECKENNNNLNELWCINVQGSAFLWHQIRFTMAVLFMIGKGNEKYDIINYLLDIDKCIGKPQYVMASDLPLILYDCVFDENDVHFNQYFKVQTTDTFCIWHQIWRERNIICNVRKIFWNKCMHGIKRNENGNSNNKNENNMNEVDKIYAELSQLNLPSSKKKNKRQRVIQHVPLVKREREPAYKERLNNMTNSKLRKYNIKQQQREFFQKQ